MPHARVDLHSAHRSRLPEISDAILQGMVEGFGMPADDLFQIFRLHEPGELVYSRTFPKADRNDIIFIELLAQVGYTDEQKQSTMGAIAKHVSALGIKADNLLLVVSEVHGAAWLAPEAQDVAEPAIEEGAR